MLLEIFYAIVGSWGRTAIEWMLANPAIVGAALLMWIVTLLSGKAQLRRIKSRTGLLVLEMARQSLEEEPRPGVDQLYDRLYPQWCQMVRRSALFIPHRWELWPLPATPSIVRGRIDFTPEWLDQYLRTFGFEVRSPGPQAKSPRGKSTEQFKNKKK
jgi:hypothetical protein